MEKLEKPSLDGHNPKPGQMDKPKYGIFLTIISNKTIFFVLNLLILVFYIQ
jgi:hypothetical protein